MKMTKFKVYDKGYLVEEVWFTCSMTAEEVKRALVDHDGYSPDIRVVEVNPVVELTKRELEMMRWGLADLAEEQSGDETVPFNEEEIYTLQGKIDEYYDSKEEA